MRLSMQDKYEFVKAAGRAREANDLTGLIRWVNSIVDAIENLPEGKADAPCPSYQPIQGTFTAFSIPRTADGIQDVPLEALGQYGPRSPIYPVPGAEAR